MSNKIVTRILRENILNKNRWGSRRSVELEWFASDY